MYGAVLRSILSWAAVVAGAATAVVSNTQAATFLEQRIHRLPERNEPGKMQAVELKLYKNASLEPRLAAQIEEEVLIVDLPAPNQYLQSIVSRLSRHWPRDEPDVRIVLASTDGCLAESNSHKVIRVCTGLLRSAANEAQVAAILAHELSHIYLRHPSASENRAGVPRSVEMLGYVLAAADMWRNYRHDGNAVLSEPARNAVYLTQATGLIWADLLGPARSRSQEEEADKLGYDLFLAAGYEPADFFDAYKLITSTTVLQTQRLEIVRSAAMARLRRAVPSIGSEALAEAVAGTTLDRIIAGIAKRAADHPSTEAREDALKEYAAKAYPRPTQLQQSTSVSGSSLETLRAFLEADDRALQALDQIDSAETVNAGNLLDVARRDLSGTHPAAELALANIQASAGKIQEAIETLEAVVQSEHAPRRAYFQLAKVYVGAGNTDAAIGALKVGARRIGRAAGFAPELVAVTRRAGFEDAAALFAMECFWLEVQEVDALPMLASTSGLYEECTKQLGYDVVRRRVLRNQSAAADTMLTASQVLLLKAAGTIEYIPARLMRRPPPADVPQRYALGRWGGAIYQQFLSYPVELELTSLEQGKPAGSSAMPTIGCRGTLVVESIRQDDLILGGSADSGKWLCESKDVQTYFVLLSANSARMELFYKNGPQPLAVAELSRK